MTQQLYLECALTSASKEDVPLSLLNDLSLWLERPFTASEISFQMSINRNDSFHGGIYVPSTSRFA